MKMRRIVGGLATFQRHVGNTVRLMIGIPEYDVYVAHVKEHHPDKVPMTYAEFFRERQDARYGGKGRISRCC